MPATRNAVWVAEPSEGKPRRREAKAAGLRGGVPVRQCRKDGTRIGVQWNMQTGHCGMQAVHGLKGGRGCRMSEDVRGQ